MNILKNKGGISEIVSYALLIMIAVTLFIIVSVVVRQYIPKFETPECPYDVNLILDDYKCNKDNPKETTFTLTNRGLFSVDAVYIRVGPEGSKIKELINKEEVFYKVKQGGLPPKGQWIWEPTDNEKDDLSTTITGDKMEIEIEPAVINDEGKLALCTGAVITQKINCSPPPPNP
jgi:hypothetical protein